MKKIICFLFLYVFFISNVMARDLRFVQITDVRYSKSDKNQVLTETIKDVNKIKNVDFVIFTGDNIKSSKEEDLKNFLNQANKLKRPFYMAIGEKDVNKHNGLSKKQYAKIAKKNLSTAKDGNINYVFHKNGVIFIVMDGSKDVIPGSNGYYKDTTLDFLELNLSSNSDKNVVILQHFPIIPPEKDENHITLKPERYLNILQNHNNVKAVISGHFGVNKEMETNGIKHISTAPAPNYRIIDIMDCTSNNPSIWAEIREAE